MVALFCTGASQALALNAPSPPYAATMAADDPHVRIAPYDPNRVLPITISVGRSAIIELAPGERVKWTVFGKDDGPVELPMPKKADGTAINTPMNNNIPLRGFEVGEENLNIVTVTLGDVERTYPLFIKVKAAPKDGADDPETIYKLKYVYTPAQLAPQPPAQSQPTVQNVATAMPTETPRQRFIRKKQEEAEARLATDVWYGERNWKYYAWGDASLLPCLNCVSDNYRLTAFRYPGMTETPTVLIVDGPAWCDPHHNPPTDWFRAQEAHADTRQQDDLLVVKQTAAHIRLRLGQHVADVSNCGFNPLKGNPGTGTTSDGVLRTAGK